MADMRITNVPQASSVTTSNDFYVKIGTTFRRVPISALLTLFQSDGFVKRTTVDGITQDLMAVEHVVLSGDGVYVSNRSYSQIAAVLDLNYMIEAELNTGNSLEYSYRGLFLCAENGSAIFAFIDPHDANDPRLLIMTVTDQNYMTGVSVESYPLNDSGGGGTADVTPTAVATAISGMNTSQKNDSRQALNAEIAGAAAAVQTTVNAILALIPSSASQNNQLATVNDLPTLTDRNSSTDTVEVKKDPTTQKLYVPTYPSGGAIGPADIVNATGQMDTTQQTSTRQNIGAEAAGAAAAVQGNLNAVTAKIPSDASSSNKLATQADLPVFSDRNASTDTVEVKKDPTTKKLYVPEGSSGPAVPTPTASDNGKYLGVVNGAYALRSAPSGGGVTIYSVKIVYRSGYFYIQHDDTDIAAEDIFTALFGGDLVQVIDDAGAECELMAISYSNPGEGRLVYKSCNMDNGPPEWRIFTIQDEIVQSEPRAEVTMTVVDMLPLTDSRSAATVASGFTVAGNTVYTVSGTISGFALSTNALPPMLPGQCIEIQLVVGSAAITTATWPSWCKKMGGWDGNFDASTYYDIVIDDAGNVFHSKREVSA